jgi:hypothetical protein
VDFDLEGDVGVVTINTAGTLPTTPIAPLAEMPIMNDRLLSIGCGGGELPQAEPIRVTALNRYDGPENIECTGVPVQGRSGGGLFDGHGQLVGVCIAADQEGQRGSYAGLKPIHDLLARRHETGHASVPAETLEPETSAALFMHWRRSTAARPRWRTSMPLNRAFGQPGAEPLANGIVPAEEIPVVPAVPGRRGFALFARRTATPDGW